jgi:hypothetical protein
VLGADPARMRAGVSVDGFTVAGSSPRPRWGTYRTHGSIVTLLIMLPVAFFLLTGIGKDLLPAVKISLGAGQPGIFIPQLNNCQPRSHIHRNSSTGVTTTQATTSYICSAQGTFNPASGAPSHQDAVLKDTQPDLAAGSRYAASYAGNDSEGQYVVYVQGSSELRNVRYALFAASLILLTSLVLLGRSLWLRFGH